MADERKGKVLAKSGKWELHLEPAEAGGWRATILVVREIIPQPRGGNVKRISQVTSTWKKTKDEAAAVARGMKRKYFS